VRLVLVIEETCFYHPGFVAKFLQNCKDEVVAVALVTKVPDKSNLELYMKKHWFLLKLSEILKLGSQKVCAQLLDLSGLSGNGRYYSVRSVLKDFNINYFEVESNINRSEYLEQFERLQPDVIVSSNSLIFGKKLLSLPKLCCINRHSALLPSYGGLWPVFQAFRNGETQTGVTIHTMDEEIDKGRILSRRVVPINTGDTIAKLYLQCFDLSADALIEALEHLRHNSLPEFDNIGAESYYSMPLEEHWREFRQRGGRFV